MPNTLVAQEAQDTYRRTRRFEGLDGLRAVAIALVIWHHIGRNETAYFERAIGVTVFFVLSGYLITLRLFREQESTGRISLPRFLLRRSLRIFPLYYAVLGLYVFLVSRLEVGTRSGAQFFGNLPFYATFTINWFGEYTPGRPVIFAFAWTLSVQEQFYLLWPVLLRFLRKRHAVIFPFVFLVAGEFADSGIGAGTGAPGVLYRLLQSLDSPIFVGVLLAYVFESRRGFRVALALAGGPVAVPLGVLLVAAIPLVPGLPREVLDLGVAYLVAAILLAPVGSLPVLGNRAVGHIGRVSYGMYLFHMLVLNAIRRPVPGLGAATLFGLTFALSTLAASLSYRYFERPVQRFGESLVGARRPGMYPTVSPGTGRPT